MNDNAAAGLSVADLEAVAERFARAVDPAEFDVPPLASLDPVTAALYHDPVADLDDRVARMAVESRRMDACRALVETLRAEVVTLLKMSRQIGPGAPPTHGVVVRTLNLITAAETEILTAERGCGAENGECTDPCHAGVFPPAELLVVASATDRTGQ